MNVLLVVDRPEAWPLDLPGVQVVSARDYLTQPAYSSRGVRVFNLCRSYRYQSLGYYVSLVGAARGHHPLPSVVTIQDLRQRSLMRSISDELDQQIQKSLAELASERLTLSVYFGRNVDERYRRLSRELFNLFPAPFLRAELAKQNGAWTIQSLRLIGLREVPDDDRPFVVQAATDYFSRRSSVRPAPPPARYDLAILFNPAEPEPPSDEVAVRRFARAAEGLGLDVEIIGPDDFGRLAEFDALFLRETTAVLHHTYRFSRRAAAEGLVVVDDPESIIRCTNKVFLAELLQRSRVPIPKTVVVHRDNLEAANAELGLPCILKRPDSSFSQGVTRVESHEELLREARSGLEESDLLIAQEFIATEFDWRVGVFDRRVLFVCRYHMARGHWQIIQRRGAGQMRYGKVEPIPPEQAPQAVLETAVRAANLIGDGFYGVDLKEHEGKVYVIEVNDNPSVEGGYEDSLLGDELYRQVMQVFLDRLERRTHARDAP